MCALASLPADVSLCRCALPLYHIFALLNMMLGMRTGGKTC
jgi:hypothetical protein